MISQGIKNLYNDKGEKKITKEYLCNIMKNTINLIKFTPDIENIKIRIKNQKAGHQIITSIPNYPDVENYYKGYNYYSIFINIVN